MATNGLLIEFGAAQKMGPAVAEALKTTVARLDAWKKENVIEEYRFYPIVTGNRSQRVALLMLEMSSEQLEALVVNEAYPKLLDGLSDVGTNITTNRAITLQRLKELASWMRD